MDRRLYIRVACLTLCIAAAPCQLQAQTEAQGDESSLLKRYEVRYQEFVDAFRSSSNEDDRFLIIQQASRDINTLLSGHLDQPLMTTLLPKLANAKLVDLESTFVEVIGDHPDRETRALAILSFARYSGNNQRQKTCEAALGFLKNQYAAVPYDGGTFGEAADESLYFYKNLAIGAPAPVMVGEDADGAVFRLTDYRGKVVMLRFWGDWCPACRRMYGFERRLVEKFRNQPFALVGVNSDPRDVCKRAQAESNLMWRSVWDGGTTNGPVSTVYRVHNWPTIIVIDSKGIIRFRSEGLDEPKLMRILERLVDDASRSDDVSYVSVSKSDTLRSPAPLETRE